MVKIPDLIIDTLKRYINELNKYDVHVKSAYLFGSYAQGNYNEWSDIDDALISDDLSGISVLDAERIARPTLNIDYRISPVTFKSEDFSEHDFFAEEIIKTGIKIV